MVSVSPAKHLKLHRILWHCAAVAIALSLPLAIASRVPAYAAADASLAIISVAAVPHSASGGNSQSGGVYFEYPDVRSLDIRVTVRLDAPNNRKVSLFVSATDQDGWRIGKAKTSKAVAPGDSTLVLEDFVILDKFFGEHDVTLDIEVSADGAGTVKTRRAFSFKGLPKPEIRVDYLDLRPRDEPLYIEFIPGENLAFNMFFEVAANEADLDCEISVFAVMDEQDFEIDRVNLSDVFWDKTDFIAGPGYYHIELYGRLPDVFREFYRERHYFRLITVFEFENGLRIEEGSEGLIYDELYGDQREPISLNDAFIRLDPSDRWRIDELDSSSYLKRIRDLRELKRTRRYPLYYGT